MEITYMSINWWMDKQNMVYRYKKNYSSIKKEWSTNTWSKIDKPWQHYTKWKKSVTEGDTLHDSIYVKYTEQANP